MKIPPVVSIDCLVCNTAFSATRQSRGRLPRFCSEKCRRARKAMQGASRAKPGARPLHRKSCAICGEAFTTTNPKTVCCGPAHGFVLLHRRSAATRKARRAERDARICQNCGAGFVARNPSGKARKGLTREGQFCSRRCASEAATKRPAKQLSLFGRSQCP